MNDTPDMADANIRPPEADVTQAFFFDVDGTLLEIAATPSGVKVEGELIAIMRRLHECTGGAVAFISGRNVADIDALFPGLRLPIAGQHGLERRDASGAMHHHAPQGVDWPGLKTRIHTAFADIEGLLLEDKGLSLAVHFRQQPSLEGRVAETLQRLVAGAGDAIKLQPGKCVLEVKPAGRDKGTAIAEFMAEPPFAGRRPVFVGDDVTDEYGFRVVNDLGGDSVKVGDGKSAARWRLENVQAVRAWLADLLAQAARADQ